MGLKKAINKITDAVKHEVKAAKGDVGKNKLFMAEHTYPNETEAREALELAKEKLFDINKWSDLEGINSTFTLFDEKGREANAATLLPGQYMRIELPGTGTENWVQIASVNNQPDFAEFTVNPSEKPAPEPDEDPDQVKHFFTEDASSTFRVELDGNNLQAFEIGLNEVINNEGEEAGNRAALNTLIAQGGWAFFQKLQWDKLTNYLVHKEES